MKNTFVKVTVKKVPVIYTKTLQKNMKRYEKYFSQKVPVPVFTFDKIASKKVPVRYTKTLSSIFLN